MGETTSDFLVHHIDPAVALGAAALVALSYWRCWLAAIPSFWFAYILTRPLGASFADWTAVSFDRGGLGWGTGTVSVGLAACIAAVVTYLAIKGKRNAARASSKGPADTPSPEPAGRQPSLPVHDR